MNDRAVFECSKVLVHGGSSEQRSGMWGSDVGLTHILCHAEVTITFPLCKMQLMTTEPLEEWLGVSEILSNNSYGYFSTSAVLDFIKMSVILQMTLTSTQAH